MKEVLENEQTLARNMLTEVPHQTLGNTQTLGAPVLGQHSREILAEIGFSADEIANMERKGVVISNQ
jgi:crotonobetainyl-CoA:carnitine CoA-transferase CaiB-like acyl-CoA transferase